MPAWDEYNLKTEVPADADTLMIKDNAAVENPKPNRRLTLSNLWDYIMSKTYAFTQGTKSIPAAIDELHNTKTDISVSGTALVINTNGSEVNT